MVPKCRHAGCRGGCGMRSRAAVPEAAAPRSAGPARCRNYSENRNYRGYLMYERWMFHALGEIVSGFSQYRLVEWILLETLGSQKNVKGRPPMERTEPVTNRQLAAIIGADSTEGVEWVAADAVRRGLIEREEVPSAKPQKGKSYSYRALIDRWEYVQCYADWKKQNQPKAEDEAEETDDQAEESGRSALRPTVTFTTEPLVMMPGAKTRPVPLSVATSAPDAEAKPKPVKVALEWENFTTAQLSIQAVHVDPSRISFAIRNGCAAASPPPANGMSPKCTSAKPNPPTQNKRVSELQAALNPTAMQFFKRPLDDEFAARVLAELEECPIDYLSAFFLGRLKRGNLQSLGVLLTSPAAGKKPERSGIAREALNSWRASQAQSAAERRQYEEKAAERQAQADRELAETERRRPLRRAIFERHKTSQGYDLNAIEADPQAAEADISSGSFDTLRNTKNCHKKRYWPYNPYAD